MADEKYYLRESGDEVEQKLQMIENTANTAENALNKANEAYDKASEAYNYGKSASDQILPLNVAISDMRHKVVENETKIAEQEEKLEVTEEKQNSLKEDLATFTGNTSYKYDLNKSVSTTNPQSQSNENNWASAIIDCSEGDVFYVKGYGGASTRLWMFSDSNGNLLTSSFSGLHANNFIKIIAPVNAAKLSVNTKYTEIKGECYKSTSMTDDKVQMLLEKGWCTKSLNWNQGMIDGETGVSRSSSQQVYDAEFYYVGKGSHVGLVCKSGFGGRVNYYNSDEENSFVSHTTQSYGATQVFIAEADYIRINAYNSTGSVITPEQMGENVKMLIISESSQREATIFTTPDRGLASFDTETNTLTLPEYAILNYGNERFSVANKSFTFTGQNDFYFMAYNPKTDETKAVPVGSNMDKNLLIDEGYVRIGYRFGKFVSVNVNPFYLVNGVIATKDDSDFAKYKQTFSAHSVAFIGDSISTYEGYSEPKNDEYYGYFYPSGDVDNVSKTWWYQVARGLRCNMSQVSVSAISRSSFRYQASDTKIVPAYDDRRINRLDDNGYPAIVYINMGTNDAFFSDLGEMPTTIDTTELSALSNTALYNTVFLTVRKIQQKYTNAVIIGLIPKWCKISASYTYARYQQTCKVIEECYNALGINYIDLRNCGITQNNVDSFTLDGTHPNADGMKKIARFIVKKTMEMAISQSNY